MRCLAISSWPYRISRSTQAINRGHLVFHNNETFLFSRNDLLTIPGKSLVSFLLKSESNAFVALPCCSPWSHRVSRSTQARHMRLCLQAPQAFIQSERAMNLSPSLTPPLHYPYPALTSPLTLPLPGPYPTLPPPLPHLHLTLTVPIPIP